MNIRELLKAIEGLPEETMVCVCEVDEAFGSEISAIEIITNARVRSEDAADQEKFDLTSGEDQVVVIRW